MIELHQAQCFLAIVAENSFSKAADALGIAQSAVSQKLRRLEDQLGIVLLDRTSRRLKLTAYGLEFLPYAQQLVDAEVRARAAARQISERARNTIRLGGYAFSADPRTDLVNDYMSRFPEGRIEVEYGIRAELFEMLRQNRVDALMVMHSRGDELDKQFDAIYYRRLDPYVALPPNSPLFARDSLAGRDFAGMRLVISPGRQDGPVLETLCQSLTKLGADLVFAPEADRRSLGLFARRLQMPSLRWLPPGSLADDEDGYRIIPVNGALISLDHYIYTRKAADDRLIKRFCRFVHETADEFGPRTH